MAGVKENVPTFWEKITPRFLKQARLRRQTFRDFDSAAYWEQRYHDQGNSGAGSYGRLALFKAEVINKFIADKDIRTVIEFGVGDGNQLKLLNVPQYTVCFGSPTRVEL